MKGEAERWQGICGRIERHCHPLLNMPSLWRVMVRTAGISIPITTDGLVDLFTAVQIQSAEPLSSPVSRIFRDDLFRPY